VTGLPLASRVEMAKDSEIPLVPVLLDSSSQSRPSWRDARLGA